MNYNPTCSICEKDLNGDHTACANLRLAMAILGIKSPRK